jgi:hypothetical protein
MLISPSWSVLNTFTPLLSNLSIICLLGCPKLLFCPTPINAILGETAFKNSKVVDVFEPMMCHF